MIKVALHKLEAEDTMLTLKHFFKMRFSLYSLIIVVVTGEYF